MTPEIKKRIEQIRHGEVPEGYTNDHFGTYPNDWKVISVRDCTEEYRELSNDIKNIPVFSSSRKGLIPQSEYYGQKDAEETNLGYKIVPNGFVTYRHMSDDDVFYFNINKTGCPILVSSEYPVFTSSKGYELGFMIRVLNYTARFRYFCRAQKLGGTRTRLYFKNLSQYHFGIPNYSEQQKIADILATQDKVIDLQKKKIEELQKLKHACLQKMFPKKGETVPEVRFPVFTDAWEQRKFDDIATRNSATAVCSSELPSVEYEDIISGQGILNKNIFEKQNIKTGIRFEPGDVLFGKLRPYLRNWILPDFSGVAVGDFWVLHPSETDSQYLYYLIQTLAFQTAANQSKGTKMPRSDWNLVSKTAFLSPKEIAEQRKIGVTLQSIDNIITLHQHKLEEMKKYKKSLMQLLLTGIVRVKT